ncbi:PAS/PAC sensor hybrid histidine kinase [Paludibacter propionicigenes WB4]|uniref:histidine kinase n=1 Tax=Paludibacter propionicigenes (strain DSM 17365 / JCM 13257 / WB4) TaxID=694427 RepID=E4T7S6_PALPW|nr:ATP-binding protein [Paludibacter propionicigenes]ADQ80770.1 PAS/PAC sensor hybrid histidine kinase [Paludibacter propionicigenes WB4]
MQRTNKHESQYASSLIEASLDPLITIDIDGKITDMNQAKVTITGVDRDKLIGSNFFDYFTEPNKAKAVYKRVFAKGSVKDCPLTFCSVDKKLTDVLFNGSVYTDAEGNVLGALLVARDVEEQKWAIELRNANKELVIANKELLFLNNEKEKRAAELILANKELVFQNKEKEKRAAELIIADKELAYQAGEKMKRAAELKIADKELVFQTGEKEKRAAELIIADKELVFQTEEKEKRETAAKELEAFSYSLKLASQYSRSLIEASRDPLFTINLEGKITDLNNASVKITGMSREEIIGTDFFDYFTEPDKAKEVYKDVFANGFVTDFPLTIRDGKLTDVLFNGSVYKDDRGNVQGVVVVARDITDQKKIETQLNEAIVFAEMATEIAEIAKTKAESSTQIAETAVKAKQQFLSNMSHEIRTPMNAIVGFTKVLLKSELTAKQKEYLSAIKMSGDALIVLINDILDLAKVDAGKMVFEKIPFKMELSISAMLHLFETKILEKNLKLVVDYDKTIPDVLVGDPVRLHQIILNLMSNAVKFTGKGKIYVSVRLLSNNDDSASVQFSIKDTGIGISEEKIGKIFENFQQASSGTSRLYGGTGLGLAIVKQLVESQGGSIHVTSEINEGSTFSFTLNFQRTSQQATEEIIAEEPDDEIKDLKVLVVEDIPLNQLLMKTLLDDFGFERDIADNGRIAIEKMKNKNYDIILMDLQMPEMNGFEATDYIRNTMHSDIPIIALTADVTTVDLDKCKYVGMNDYIAKPVDERILYSKIIGLVKKTVVIETLEKEVEEVVSNLKIIRCIDLRYLNTRTKSNPTLMMEMISLYLEQTPPLISAMKKSLEEKDWNSLHLAVHKMIPSFSIMGINADFENMARKIQDYAIAEQQADGIQELVMKLGDICSQACKELEEEYNMIKSKN